MSTPEARLLAELVRGAIKDYAIPMSNTAMIEHARTVRAEAGEWLRSDSIEPFSMLWVCQRLGIEPREVRAEANASLLKYRQALIRKAKRRNER